jgi:hypothetical protein
MSVFRVEKNKGYTVMSNHHLRNADLLNTESNPIRASPRAAQMSAVRRH